MHKYILNQIECIIIFFKRLCFWGKINTQEYHVLCNTFEIFYQCRFLLIYYTPLLRDQLKIKDFSSIFIFLYDNKITFQDLTCFFKIIA